ncbi:GDSL-type esterase/lipase family protein [Rhizobiaceae bacterium]|nr:GDSL-type esterase/lipase family protein [Rhizobiaceae bacterium]
MTSKPAILCFGDSNTHGTRPMRGFRDVGRYLAKQRWPGVTQDILGDSAEIVEAGHPGRTTLFENRTGGGNRSGLNALGLYLESNCPLDCVVLMLGTNDLHAHYSLSAQVVAWNLAQLVELIQRSPCGPVEDRPPHVLIVSPPHIAERGFAAEAMAGASDKSKRLAVHYESLARQYGTSFLDAAAIVEPDPLDGIHLSSESHVTLGVAIAGKLTAVLQLGE